MLAYYRKRRRVYLIRRDCFYKIGSSSCPAGRLETLCPDGNGELLHQIESLDAFKIENALHRRFSELRVESLGREWFSLSDAHVEAICGLGRIDRIDDLPDGLRPSQRDIAVLAAAKINASLMREAKAVATRRGVSLCCYLGAILGPAIAADYRETFIEQEPS